MTVCVCVCVTVLVSAGGGVVVGVAMSVAGAVWVAVSVTVTGGAPVSVAAGAVSVTTAGPLLCCRWVGVTEAVADAVGAAADVLGVVVSDVFAGPDISFIVAMAMPAATRTVSAPAPMCAGAPRYQGGFDGNGGSDGGGGGGGYRSSNPPNEE